MEKTMEKKEKADINPPVYGVFDQISQNVVSLLKWLQPKSY